VGNTLYKSWIPTVSGRLSFSLFGDTEHPSQAKGINVSDGVDRYIIFSQRRNLSDSILPDIADGFLQKVFLGLDGVFNFVCIAHNDDRAELVESPLSGKILLFYNAEGWGNYASKLEKLKSRLQSYDLSGPISLNTYISQQYQELSQDCLESDIEAEFSLTRSGVVTICIDWEKERAKVFLHQQSFVDRMGHSIASQLFFFLKDIGHRHQHHNPNTDTILDVYGCDNDNDDYTWRCRVMRELYRKVLVYKRDKRAEVMSSSLGVLAYAQAFAEIGKTECKKELNPKLLEASLEKSIRVSSDALGGKNNELQRITELFKSTAISLIGLFLGFVGLLQIKGGADLEAKPSDSLIFFGKALIEFPIITLAVSVIIALAIIMPFGPFRPEVFSWVRASVRAISGIRNKFLAGLTLVAIGLLIIWLLVLLFYLYIVQ